MQTENTPSFFEVCDFKMILLLCDLQTKDNGVYNENITLVANQKLFAPRENGTYIYTVQTKGEVFSGKFIKM